jgi:predicted phage tail component-like protein
LYGLTFNGKNSSEFGLVMQSKNRPILPEPKLVYEEMPGQDGELDYSEINPDGRTKWKPRIHEITFEFDRRNLNCRDPRLVRIRAHEIALWLMSGEQRLIYDDETAVFYLARVSNKLDMEAQITPNRPFTVQFKCRPYGYLVTKSNEQLQFGQGLMLGYGLKLMSPTVYNVAGNTELTVYNSGTFVKPIIRINGSFTTISIACNGKTLSYNAALSNSQLDIDCHLMQVYQGLINKNTNMTGDFLELVKGDNAMQITGTGLNCTITIEFRPLYL